MKFKTQLSIVNVILLVLLCIISAVMYHATTTLIENTGWVTHTSTVIGNANALVKAMVDMETGQRGFMLTGKERFLEPYYSGGQDFNETLETSINLVSDNPPQVKRLQKIQQLKEHWFKSAGEYEINLKKQIDLGELPEEALNHVLEGRTVDGLPQSENHQSGKQIMDEIREVVDAFIMVERSLMKQRVYESEETGDWAKNTAIFGAIIAVFLGVGAMVWMRGKLMAQLGAEPTALIAMSQDVASGNMTARIEINEKTTASDGNVATALNHMAETMQENIEKLEAQTWQETSRSQLHEQMRGQHEIHELGKRIISFLCKQVSAEMGAIYCVEESTDLTLIASYASAQSSQASKRIAQGEGLVGQVANEQRMIVITEVPEDYFPISSALGHAIPKSVLMLPFLTDQEFVGVIELCSLRVLSDEQILFIKSVAESIAVVIKTTQNRRQMEVLLERTKQQAGPIQSNDEEFTTWRETSEEHARV